MDVVVIVALVVPAVTAGAAWGAVKHGLNGTATRIERIEEKVHENGERIARVETIVSQK